MFFMDHVFRVWVSSHTNTVLTRFTLRGKRESAERQSYRAVFSLLLREVCLMPQGEHYKFNLFLLCCSALCFISYTASNLSFPSFLTSLLLSIHCARLPPKTPNSLPPSCLPLPSCFPPSTSYLELVWYRNYPLISGWQAVFLDLLACLSPHCYLLKLMCTHINVLQSL